MGTVVTITFAAADSMVPDAKPRRKLIRVRPQGISDEERADLRPRDTQKASSRNAEGKVPDAKPRRRLIRVRSQGISDEERADLRPRDTRKASSKKAERKAKNTTDEFSKLPKVALLKKGQKMSGTVTKIIPTGFFVEIGVGKDGFVPLDKAADLRVTAAVLERLVHRGDEVTVWVERVTKEGKIEMSRRPPVNVSGFVGVPPDQWLSGVVTKHDIDGIFVKVYPPSGGEVQQGKVMLNEIRAGAINPKREVRLFEEVTVRVIEVDTKRQRLWLSMRDPDD